MGPWEDAGSATGPGTRHPGTAPGRHRTAARHGHPLRAGRRAVRVTLSAVAAFHTGLYGLHDPVTATYTLFAAVAMAGLSRMAGTGHQHAAIEVQDLPAGWIPVTAEPCPRYAPGPRWRECW